MMNTQLKTQFKIQHFMLASGMIYALLQMAILAFAAMYVLPKLGTPDASISQRFEAYAHHGELLRIGNYLMVLPPFFFFLFLGGLYAYFLRIDERIKGILFTALLSGAALIMLWPQGAVLSLLGVEIAAKGGDQVTAATFDSIVPASLALSTIPRSVFLFSLSILLLNKKGLSRAGFLIAGLSLSGSLLLAFGGPFLPMSLGSAVLFHLWVFCCSYSMSSNRKQFSENLSSAHLSSYA